MTERLRVTFVLPHAGLAGGIRVAAIYADWLHAQGHKVTVVSTPRRSLTLAQRAKNVLRGRSASNKSQTPSHFDNSPVEHRVIDRFRPMTDADVPDADVIIATWWETAEWVAAMSPRKGAKVYFIQHDETHANQPTARVDATWHLPMTRLVVADWLADIGRQRHGVECEVVPNGVDPQQFNAPPRAKNRTPTVGLMYATVPFKGCDIALEAFRLAQQNVPKLKLVSFGQTDEDPNLPLPSDTRYERQPPQGQLKDFYAACDAWLFASRSEGFGLPILEAMACRTPVIGTPAGAAPELIREAGGGIVVKPQDAMDMARAIEKVAGMSPAEWQAMSDAAYQTAMRHTWDQSARAFEEALKRAASVSIAA